MGKLCELHRKQRMLDWRLNSLKSKRPCKIRRMRRIEEVKQSQKKGAYKKKRKNWKNKSIRLNEKSKFFNKKRVLPMSKLKSIRERHLSELRIHSL